MPGMSRSAARRSLNVWPGWVDALSTLVMVIIFVLMVFVIAQTYLSATLSGREQALQRLTQQVAELADLLEDDAVLGHVCDTLRRRKAKPTDKVTFAIQGETPFYPVESDLWHDWWRDFRRALGADNPGRPARRTQVESGRLVPCLASGELVEPAATHP